MRIHFIGIGGIGISALAQYYLSKGNKVTGSDLSSSEIITVLKKKGVKIFSNHKPSNIFFKNKLPDLAIYSSAIPRENPELKEVKKFKIKTKSYSQALGDLTKEYFTIAVSGTHGKSTTTALIALTLIKAKLNPTVIIGTKLKEFNNSNFRKGGVNCLTKKPILVIEADEYKSAFLNYNPEIIVLTSIEREHLDYFRNLKNILRIYKKYINKLPQDGLLIANKDDKYIEKILKKKKPSSFLVLKYSLIQKEVKKLKEILKIPGKHNISNALAVLTLARFFKIPDKISFQTFSDYKGAWRRFEIIPVKIGIRKYILINDYAHHPTEIKATLEAVREKFKKRRIILIYQPHQYQRTKILFKDFIESFDDADYLILNEIYEVQGRETKKDISSNDLKKAIEKRWKKLSYNNKVVRFIKEQDNILKELPKILKKDDILIIMGAGDIYNLSLKLKTY